MTVLVTRPRYDNPTHYLFYWAGILIDEAKKRKTKVIDLDREKVTQKIVQSYLSKQPVDVVILNGHGSQEAVAGHEGEIIISTGNGTGLLKNKAVFIRACDSGSTLGREIKSMGAAGFIGYIQPFIFPFDKDSVQKPLKDELAAPILECSNQVGLSLIKGKSVEEAQKDSKDKYAKAIDKYSSSEASNSFLLPFLHWNMTFQVCY